MTINIQKFQPMATPISDNVVRKGIFENHAIFEYSHNGATKISPIRILVVISNDNRYYKPENIEKIPRELWVNIFLSFITPRNFEPLIVLGSV
jgi:hypothetical protein